MVIEDIRFIQRDGKKILQIATKFELKDGEIERTWQDVPLVLSDDEKNKQIVEDW